MRKFFTFYTICMFLTTLVFAQNVLVTGTVTDQQNGDPLIGVNVYVKGTSMGTITDIDGKYSMEIPPQSTLVFSYIGFLDQEIEVGDRSVIDLKMVGDVEQLSEVVITALGIERERESLGYSASEIEGKALAQSQAPNVANALSGRAPGVFVTNPSSIEGGSTRVTIRGNTSLSGGNQPLIIVDGLPYANDISATSTVSNRDYGSALNQVEALDIERMDILKGTAASALYGSRGANGVILITTKKGAGRSGMKVEYTLNTKLTQPYRFQDFQNQYGLGGPSWALWEKPVLGSTFPEYAKIHGTSSSCSSQRQPLQFMELRLLLMVWDKRLMGTGIRQFDDHMVGR